MHRWVMISGRTIKMPPMTAMAGGCSNCEPALLASRDLERY
jgi:hypothetical protein